MNESTRTEENQLIRAWILSLLKCEEQDLPEIPEALGTDEDSISLAGDEDRANLIRFASDLCNCSRAVMIEQIDHEALGLTY